MRSAKVDFSSDESGEKSSSYLSNSIPSLLWIISSAIADDLIIAMENYKEKVNYI